MNALLLALVLLVMNGEAGSIHGRIVSGDGGGPVSGALVRVTGPGADQVVLTALDGAFDFRTLPLGEYRVRVAHPGYAPLDLRVVLRSGGDVSLMIPLVVRPIALEPIDVRGERGSAGSFGAASVSPRVSAAALPSIVPSLFPQSAAALAYRVSGDVLRDPARDPGTGRPAHALYLWGSSAERGRVFVDGATLNAPMHLGGMLPPLDTELLADAGLRTGGISPRFDGGTAYIMDFVTRPGSGGPARMGGELDPLTTRFGFETPLGALSSMAVTARRVNSEAVDLLVGESFGYAYRDLLGRVDRRLSRGGHLFATVVGTQEAIVVPRDQAEDEAEWQNLAATLSWRGRVGEAQRSAAVTFSRGGAGLPLLTAPGGRVESGVDRWSAIWEERRELGRVWLNTGIDAEHIVFRRRSSALALAPGGEFEEFVACTRELPCLRAAATNLSAFGEVTGPLSFDLSARVGLRIAVRPGSGTLDLLPRASLTRLIGTQTTVTLAAGRFSQVYTRLQPGTESTLHPEGAQPRVLAAITHATHLEVNLDRTLGHAGITTTVFLHRHTADADGPARTSPGVDLAWGYFGERISGSAGYSFTGAGWGTGARQGARDRHLAAVDLGLRARAMTLQLSGAWGHGLPLTSIALDHPEEATSVDTFHATRSLRSGGGAGLDAADPGDRPHLRLDAAASSEWSLTWRGRAFTLAPYVKVLNALSHRDALFYLRDEAGSGSSNALATLPALPVLGVRWEF